MIIAIDTENGEAYGPFESHEQADERILGFMLELGEWRGGEDATASGRSRYDADFTLMIEHFSDLEQAGADGHEDRDACRAILCSAVEEAGWQVMDMQPLEPGAGLGDDIHEQRHPRQQTEAEIQAQVDAGYQQHIDEMREHPAADGADGRDAHAS